MTSPKLPKTNTLTGRALMRLMTGRKFTHRDFQNETASYRLSSCIEQLRNRHGWLINTVEQIRPTNDPTGRNANYAYYSLDPEYLLGTRNLLGESFENFINAVLQFENRGSK